MCHGRYVTNPSFKSRITGMQRLCGRHRSYSLWQVSQTPPAYPNRHGDLMLVSIAGEGGRYDADRSGRGGDFLRVGFRGRDKRCSEV